MTVPGIVPASMVGDPLTSAERGEVSFASPKSRIFTRPSSVMKMFSGFRSRCTIPRSCAAASPSTICRA
jgi:hypothetical protein